MQKEKVSSEGNSDLLKKDAFQPYGRYSLGSGYILQDRDRLFDKIADPKIIDEYKKAIRTDLQKAGIPLSDLPDYNIIDVGTGRQAIAFHQLGAGNVRHYDLSSENVSRLHEYIEKKKLDSSLSARRLDLVEFELPREWADFVYLHGIVQHFSHAGRGLLNCMNAVKKGGRLWLYFYRSGTFTHFVIGLLRDLITEKTDYRQFFVNATLLYSDMLTPNYFVSSIMDNLFVPYAHLYTPASYMEFVDRCGFEIVSSSKLDPLGKAVDHTFANESVILVCIKKTAVDVSGDVVEILSPTNSVNQLQPAVYNGTTDQHILEIIDAYGRLKSCLTEKNISQGTLMAITFWIYVFLTSVNAGELKGDRHEMLKQILNRTIDLINREM